MDNLQYYPTPDGLALRMVRKFKSSATADTHITVCDPSAGAGDLLKAYKKEVGRGNYADNYTFYSMELDYSRATLAATHSKLLGYDFMAWNGYERFDAIIMNPPFAHGVEHLNRALDVLDYEGEIVCLLNAETIKNPYSVQRKALIHRLDAMGATFEYVQAAFTEAERKTNVECVIIHAKAPTKPKDVFDDVELKTETVKLQDTESEVVQAGNKIDQLVSFYEAARNEGLKIFQTMQDARKHFKLIDADAPFLTLSKSLHEFLEDLKNHYWRQILQTDDFTSKLPSAQRRKLAEQLVNLRGLEFSYDNIYRLRDAVHYKQREIIQESAIAIFDKMSRDHTYYPECKNNIYLFNGWKSNNAYKINKKVVLPFSRDKWSTEPTTYETKCFIRDLQKVLNMFCTDLAAKLLKAMAFDDDTKLNDTDGSGIDYLLNNLLGSAKFGEVLDCGVFSLKVFKKGTVHITFNDLDMLHRFNAFVCKAKGWLPHDYGAKPKKDMTLEEQAVVTSFGDYFIIDYTAIGMD